MTYRKLAAGPWLAKVAPQVPFKATTQNSAYRRDWRSPGAQHFQQRVFLHVFVVFG